MRVDPVGNPKFHRLLCLIVRFRKPHIKAHHYGEVLQVPTTQLKVQPCRVHAHTVDTNQYIVDLARNDNG